MASERYLPGTVISLLHMLSGYIEVQPTKIDEDFEVNFKSCIDKLAPICINEIATNYYERISQALCSIIEELKKRPIGVISKYINDAILEILHCFKSNLHFKNTTANIIKNDQECKAMDKLCQLLSVDYNKPNDVKAITIKVLQRLLLKPSEEWRFLSNEWKTFQYILHTNLMVDTPLTIFNEEIIKIVAGLLSSCNDNELIMHLMKILGTLLKKKDTATSFKMDPIICSLEKHVKSYNGKKKVNDYKEVISTLYSAIGYCTVSKNSLSLQIASSIIFSGLLSEYEEYTEPSLYALEKLIEIILSNSGAHELNDYPVYLEDILKHLLTQLRNKNADVRKQASSMIKDICKWIPIQTEDIKSTLMAAIPIMIYGKNDKETFNAMHLSIKELMKKEEYSISKYCNKFSEIYEPILSYYIDEKGAIQANLLWALKELSERQLIFCAFQYLVALKNEQLTRMEVLKSLLVPKK